MGQGLGLAMGAWFGAPSGSDGTKCVVAIVGDGGLAMAAPELQTCVTNGIGVKIVLINNGLLGITHAYEKRLFGDRIIACGPPDYQLPDWKRVAGAYGVSYLSAHEPDLATMQQRIREVLLAPGPVLLDVPCPGWANYAPRLEAWDAPIEEVIPSLPPEEFLANMRYVTPVPGWEKRRSG